MTALSNLCIERAAPSLVFNYFPTLKFDDSSHNGKIWILLFKVNALKLYGLIWVLLTLPLK